MGCGTGVLAVCSGPEVTTSFPVSLLISERVVPVTCAREEVSIEGGMGEGEGFTVVPVISMGVEIFEMLELLVSEILMRYFPPAWVRGTVQE